MCIQSFNILALKLPEKTPTQNFNVNMLCRERKKKWMKNRKIRAMTLSLNSTIQKLILHMYTILKIRTQIFNINMQYRERKKN